MRWPVEEMGKKSVTPSTKPMMTALTLSKAGSSDGVTGANGLLYSFLEDARALQRKVSLVGPEEIPVDLLAVRRGGNPIGSTGPGGRRV